MLGAQVIVTSLTRSVRYCIKKVLGYNNVSLPSTIRMRIDLRNLCTLCGEARLRFKLEFRIYENFSYGKVLQRFLKIDMIET